MFTKIGPFARHRLRRCSPFASLLQDITMLLSPEEVANLKLAISVDRKNIVARKDVCKIRFAAECLDLLESSGIIEADNLEYLEYLFLKWGRKDLVKEIQKYHDKRTGRDQTVPKSVSSSISCTQLKTPLQPRNRNTFSPTTHDKPTYQPKPLRTSKACAQDDPRPVDAVAAKQPPLSCSSFYSSGSSPRQAPTGSSCPDHIVPSSPTLLDHADSGISYNPLPSSTYSDKMLPTAIPGTTEKAHFVTFSHDVWNDTCMMLKKPAETGSPSSSQESQMSVDDQQLSQMSISDDEKTWKLHGDKVVATSPMDVAFTNIKN